MAGAEHMGVNPPLPNGLSKSDAAGHGIRLHVAQRDFPCDDRATVNYTAIREHKDQQSHGDQ